MILSWDYFVSDPGQRALQNVVAIVAIVLAIRGVRNWKLERRDLRRAELAERALAHAYLLRDIISTVRDPWGYEGEGETRKAEANESAETKDALNTAFIPIERLNRHAAAFEETGTLAFTLKAAFGPNAADSFLVFMRIRGRIIAAARSKMRGASPHRTQTEAFLARIERNDAVIYSESEGDAIAAEIDAAIAALEERYRHIVEARFDRNSYAVTSQKLLKRLKRTIAPR